MGELPLTDFADEHTEEFQDWCNRHDGELISASPNEWKRMAICDLPSGESITVYPVADTPNKSGQSDVRFRVLKESDGRGSHEPNAIEVPEDGLNFNPDLTRDDAKGMVDMGIGYRTYVAESDLDLLAVDEDGNYLSVNL